MPNCVTSCAPRHGTWTSSASTFVEVNPKLDVGTGGTSYLGAHTMVEFLGANAEAKAARR